MLKNEPEQYLIFRPDKPDNYLVKGDGGFWWGSKDDAFSFDSWDEAEKWVSMFAFPAYVEFEGSIVPLKYRTVQ